MIDSFLTERENDLEQIVNTIGFAERLKPGRLSSVFMQLQRTSSAFVDLAFSITLVSTWPTTALTISPANFIGTRPGLRRPWKTTFTSVMSF